MRKSSSPVGEAWCDVPWRQPRRHDLMRILSLAVWAFEACWEDSVSDEAD